MKTLIDNNNGPSRKLFVLKIKESESRQSREIEYTEEDEIRYKGNMYDVVEKKESDGFVYFYCMSDSLDERLYEELNNCVDANTIDSSPESSHHQNDQQLLKNIVKDYFVAYSKNTYTIKGKHFFPDHQEHRYINIYGETPYPPPQFI